MKNRKATTDYSDSYKDFKGGGNPRKSVVNKRENEYPYKDLTCKIIGAAMEVHKELECGFIELDYCLTLEEFF
ncbi:MAG: hypothetical protein ABH952_08955 [Candidatus Omnitrophota bacterium]